MEAGDLHTRTMARVGLNSEAVCMQPRGGGPVDSLLACNFSEDPWPLERDSGQLHTYRNLPAGFRVFAYLFKNHVAIQII